MDSCSGLQKSHFSASVSISVLREYNNTYWPTSQGCGEAFSLQSTRKRKSPKGWVLLSGCFGVFPCPQTPQVGIKIITWNDIEGQLFLLFHSTSGKESWINEISLVLRFNRDEILKRIQLLGQANMFIFVFQVKFQLTSLFLKVKQGVVVLGGARKLFSNIFFSSKTLYFRGE